MPWTPLGAISGNIQYRKELTPLERLKIQDALDFGATISEISSRYAIPKSTIKDTKQ
jgi:hypothetical protein